KDNGEKSIKSIKEGPPIQMGTVSNVIAGGTEGAVQQGPVRARGPLTRTFSAEEKDKGYKRTFVQPISYSRYTKGHLLTSSNHYTNAKDIWENVKMILERRNHSRILLSLRSSLNDTRNIKKTMPMISITQIFEQHVAVSGVDSQLKSNFNKGSKSQTLISLCSLKQHEVQANENENYDGKEKQVTNVEKMSERFHTENDLATSKWTRKKAETLAPKPISALTVYPPNTPVKLVPRVLPTKSQEAPDFNSFFKIKNLEHQIQEKDNVIRHLKDLVANVNDRSCEPYNAKDVTALIEQNDCVRVELEKVKQHYKELYDSIKITRAHTSEKTSTMLDEIESLKAQLRSKESCFRHK
ncbi:hypothetical protein Tco_1262879, partial [Tanacetum coccineum]